MRPVEKAGVLGLRLRLLIFSMTVFKDAGSAEAGEGTSTGAGGIGNANVENSTEQASARPVQVERERTNA